MNLVLAVIGWLIFWVPAAASGATLACADPVLSEEEFNAALGPKAAAFALKGDVLKRCDYAHPAGTTIRIETRAAGNYTADEFHSKKEADIAKAKSESIDIPGVNTDDFSAPKPVDIPGLGAAAYKVGTRSASVINVLDRSKTRFFEVEIKVKGIAMSADEAAKRLARAVEAAYYKTQEKPAAPAAASGPQEPTAECSEKLSAADIQRILGLSPDQYEFRSGADKSCAYHVRESGGRHRILRFSPKRLVSRQEANTMLATVRASTVRSLSGIGSAGGAMSSGQIWFISTNRRWLVTVSYHEVAMRDADQLAVSGHQEDSVRDNVARTIDKNLSSIP